MNSRVNLILITFLIIFSLTNCAKRGRPTGGEKDITPPISIGASPAQETINFNAKKIKITFSEYIKLKDINKKLIISPPLKYNPEIIPVGTASKQISIKLIDTLKENTTYTFNFGNSVEDNNEGNPLESFKYVFSTGNYIDSLKISGNVTDAFNLETDRDILVMLYEIDSTFSDSIIYKEKPKYVTSTLDSTNFELTNLKEGNYLLLALKQPNNNYIFKPKQDKIGFIKTPITLPTDSTFDFSIFKEILPFKMRRGTESTKGHIILGYEGDPKDLKIKLLDTVPENFNSEFVFDKEKDTLNYWFSSIEKDSLQFEVTNLNFKDTLTVKLKSSKQDSLILKSSISSVLNIRDTFAVVSNIPLTKIDTTKISLVDKDTIAVPFITKLDKYKNNLQIHFKKEYENNYQLNLLPEALHDVFGNTNDTLLYKAKTKKLEEYGALNLKVANVESQVIIELVTEKFELVDRKIINSNTTVSFKNLPPKKYLIRAVFDDNNNGVWDTGNYLLKTTPEKIIYFEKLIELRANWDLNEDFPLK